MRWMKGLSSFQGGFIAALLALTGALISPVPAAAASLVCEDGAQDVDSSMQSISKRVDPYRTIYGTRTRSTTLSCADGRMTFRLSYAEWWPDTQQESIRIEESGTCTGACSGRKGMWDYQIKLANNKFTLTATGNPSVSINAVEPNKKPTSTSLNITTYKNETSSWRAPSVNDPDDSSHTFTILSQSDKGTAQLNSAKTQIRFQPKAGFSGQTSFTYRATDPHGAYVNGTAYVTVNNRAPTATALSMQVYKNEESDWAVPSVTDPDDTQHSFQITAQSTNGTALVSPDGREVRFTPHLGFAGDASFGYRAVDPDGASVVGTASIKVINRPPTATSLVIQTRENTPSGWFAPPVTDPDDAVHQITILQQSPDGHAEVSEDGRRVRFTPNAGFYGDTTFRYRATDAHDASVDGTATVTVEYVNKAPTETTLSITTREGVASGWVAPTVTDVDDTVWTVAIVEQSPNGQATAMNSRVQFVPAPGFYGDTSFVYRVTDSAGNSLDGTAHVAVVYVNKPPTKAALQITTNKGQTSSWVTPTVTDIDDSAHTFEIAEQSADGTAELNADRTAIRFIPNSDFFGTTTFRFVTIDPSGNRHTDTAFVDVINRAPTATSLHIDTNKNEASKYVKPSVTDPDDTVHYVTILEQSENGVAEVADHAVRFVPEQGFFGDTGFTYQVMDPAGNVLQGTATVSVRNQAPTHTEVTIKALEGQPSLVTTPTTEDVDDDRHELEIIEGPKHGTLAVINGGFQYTPKANYHGADAFRYRAVDREGLSVEGIGDVVVHPFAFDVEDAAGTWTASRMLSTKTFELKQLRGDACDFIAPGTEVTQGAQPVCAVEWTADVGDLTSKATSPTTLSGQLVAPTGRHAISYKVTGYHPRAGLPFEYEGQAMLTVVDPEFVFAIDGVKDQVFRVIDKVNVGITQVEGERCYLTTDIAIAKAAGADRAPLYGCYVEWTDIPDGLAADERSRLPALTGAITAAGEERVAATVSMFTAGGDQVQVAEVSLDFDVVNPPAPELVFSGGDTTEDGTYLVSPAGGNVTYVRASAPAGTLRLTVHGTGSEEPIVEEGGGWGFSRAPSLTERVSITPGALWSHRTVRATAEYVDMPDLRTTASINIMHAPDSSIRISAEAPRKAINTEAIPVEVSIGTRRGATTTFDPETMGTWTTWIEKRTRDGERSVVTDEREVSDGVELFEIDPDSVDSVTYVAFAKSTSPDGSYTKVIESFPMYVTVLQGMAIESEVNSRRYRGIAPFTTVFTLSLDRTASEALGQVEWQVSPATAGAFETVASGDRLTRLIYTFQRGEYDVRAKITNRHTGAVGYSETVAVHAFVRPELTVTGAREAFIGTNLELQAETTFEGAPTDAVVEWLEGDQVVGEGKTFVVSRESDGVVNITVRARMQDAPADERYAWVDARYPVRFRQPAAPYVRIDGPTYTEVGTTYTFKALTQLPYRNMSEEDNRIMGEWTLPNGTTVQGDTLEFSPTDEMAEEGRVELSYRVWIEGLESLDRTDKHRASVRKYVWPEFALSTEQRMALAPSTVKMRIETPGFYGRLDGPEYEWNFPAGAVVQSVYGDVASIEILEPGEYEVSARITDSRGNSAVVSAPISVGQADPWSVDLEFTYSNKAQREPVDVAARPSASGGHPHDWPVSYRYFLNGELYSEGKSYSKFAGLTAGRYLVRFEMDTKHGKTAFIEKTVEVAANQPPSCEIKSTYRTFGPSYLFEADCTDVDGRIVGYRWVINGEVAGLTGYRIGVPVKEGEKINVEVTATDDSGGTATVKTVVQ